jgi:hypothetical protein
VRGGLPGRCAVKNREQEKDEIEFLHAV